MVALSFPSFCCSVFYFIFYLGMLNVCCESYGNISQFGFSGNGAGKSFLLLLL